MPFILIIFALLALTAYYISRRIHRGINIFFPKVHFAWVVSPVSILVLFLVLSFIRSVLPLSEEANNIIGIIGGYSMGIYIYLIIYTVVFEVISFILRVSKLAITRHRLFNGITAGLMLFCTFATCLYGTINAHHIDTVSYKISLEDKADISDLNVVLISDLHLGAVHSESRLDNIVDKINSLKPDVVCIAGDFFDTDFASVQNPESAIQTLKKIRSTFGTYACFGNHDGGRTYKQMENFLKKADIKLLSDEYIVIDNRLVLVGRMDSHPIGGYGKEQRKKLSQFFTPSDSSMPVIVMDHNPANINEYGKEADVILCGHTHRGQLFPGSLITDSIYDVDYGYYQKDKNSPQVVVTSGIGYWGIPMRVGTNCEVVKLSFSN